MTTIKIQNPVLKGFNPDPSILRVGDDYYMATSTFEWYPGVQIHHSRDMMNWQTLSYALDRPDQLDMKGIEASGGVWAPCLSYDEQEQTFYLIYTIMRSTNGNAFDLDNYVVTAKDILGPWSERIYLNSSGFDPSLFHDDDGRKWLVNLEWETRKGYEHPGSIVIQEYDPVRQELTGTARSIFRGATDMGCMEAPHIYKRDGYYYMMTAEGGTGFGHGVTMARSRELFGPYESDPCNPIITSAKLVNLDRRNVDDYLKPYQYNPDSLLQKSGHGSLVETQNGEWYIAHLCSRPVLPQIRSMLGRETAIQACQWTEDGWLRMIGGGQAALTEAPAPKLAPHPFAPEPAREDFDSGEWNIHLNSLRVPIDEDWATLSARPGFLRLRGRQSLFSLHEQSLVARRLQSVNATVETCAEFTPENYHQSAGLTLFYDQNMFYYLRIYYSESLGGKCVGILYADNGAKVELTESRLPAADWERIYLRAELRQGMLIFLASPDGEQWQQVGPELDGTKCSDEYSTSGHFTGAFVGINCQDSYRRQITADFDYFEYREHK
ncbi:MULTISPECIES: glycoside hydrolase family 43 protein [unclassified Paenibacillus]|uniref:glycoside hydrolase family 43 protein n=1 Tax=unclassified Paenibacillus TaxID=185978 RepID=UPI0024075E4C|nr:MULTISPECIES: glycoside hydrolase family 43 protein [unclassified Paenibacillus]MDF9842563.1 xylan 1,4-beta-xylosidase [Paenibacillus sp. PastF-2]MDF9849230.1 xylan 1,4-beta-xylosidase [Paenibacillus sp. PastM-2]MDF9855723.1 xylan 1,4-beta-xylosidase [Paenibacillus sp. PastF-1]MDH6481072.1 xylan 1,4-beta-xylosidase [Paenibacillus sp. PastH-2]MDH6508416.1 xylan 1,4-beta-xylosidase [Paenibacillus sp. PastM-3]